MVADTNFPIISPVSRVSIPIAHFPVLINLEKPLQNFITSSGKKSFPYTPLIPEIEIFTSLNQKRFL